MEIWLAKLIPWLPAGAAVLCGLCATKRAARSLAAPLCVAALFGSFLISLGTYPLLMQELVPEGPTREFSQKRLSATTEPTEASTAPSTSTSAESVTATAMSATTAAASSTTTAASDAKSDTTEPADAIEESPTRSSVRHDHAPHGKVIRLADWIEIGGFSAPIEYFFDPLTMIMLFVITGIGTLVAVYASGYMKGDIGYARFFAFVSLFIFSMTTLVMANNLVLLYLGWEGVGLCSYLLIGHYYDRPSAVAAAKKAFIVNRVGDLGFALGIFLTFQTFGTVTIGGEDGIIARIAHLPEGTSSLSMTVIPFLLMLGAFGKSAQLPLHVWLPDAMEGPTPVSALIHAATMVTAGIYMIARLLPLFELSPMAMSTIACVGGITALFAASIALCQNDIKRVFAYSTVSQLGYMFVGIGALSTVGGVFHLFTHAFFKALLFLTAGSVMHALAGQLDLRKMSGLRHKMPVTCWLMFAGCLALAGFPFTSGFYSKDLILADVFNRGINGHQMMYTVLGVMGLLTALLTAFYTFRLWFRVFMGPERYEMGHEHHGESEGQSHDKSHAHASEPHEMPWLMNGPLLLLAIGALGAGYACHGWIEGLVNLSTAASNHTVQHVEGGVDTHTLLMVLSSVVSIVGILLAAIFHWWNRPACQRAAELYPSIIKILENKYYIDEFYDAFIVRPLRALGEVFFAFDRLVIDAIVSLVGFAPRFVGLTIRPLQNGSLQGYGLGMVTGLALVMLLLLLALK